MGAAILSMSFHTRVAKVEGKEAGKRVIFLIAFLCYLSQQGDAQTSLIARARAQDHRYPVTGKGNGAGQS